MRLCSCMVRRVGLSKALPFQYPLVGIQRRWRWRNRNVVMHQDAAQRLNTLLELRHLRLDLLCGERQLLIRLLNVCAILACLLRC